MFAPVLAWFARAFAGLTAYLTTATLGHVAAHQAAEAVARLTRIAIWLGIIVLLFNLITPSYCSSLYTCFNEQKGSLGSIVNNIAYFVPVDLLLCLMDLYLFTLMILFTVSSVRRVAEFGR